jgi:hypothetical protein
MSHAFLPSAEQLTDDEFAAVREFILAELERTQPHDTAPSKADNEASGPHLTQPTVFNLTHSHRHLRRLADPAVQGDKASVAFNADHANHHADEAMSDLDRLIAWCRANVSGFDAEWQKLSSHLGAAPPAKPAEQSMSARSANREMAERNRRWRQRLARQPRPCRMWTPRSPLRVRVAPAVRDVITDQVGRNRGLETGGLLFAPAADGGFLSFRPMAVTPPSPAVLPAAGRMRSAPISTTMSRRPSGSPTADWSKSERGMCT